MLYTICAWIRGKERIIRSTVLSEEQVAAWAQDHPNDLIMVEEI